MAERGPTYIHPRAYYAAQSSQRSGRAYEGYTPSGWAPVLRLWSLMSLGGLAVAGLVGTLAAIALGVL